MKKVAITGNIAAGKSQAEKIISKYFPVYDTDIIAHEILDNIDEFYNLDVFTNGKIDRKKLGKLVFENPEIKNKLEKFIHPLIKTKLEEIFEKHINEDFVFVSVPLLFEAKWENHFDKIIIITAKDELRLERLISRNNLSKNDAQNRIRSQIPQEDKIKNSDYIIENNGTENELAEKVFKLLKEEFSVNA